MLEDINYVGTIDKSNMLSLLSNFPQQCKEAVDTVKSLELHEKFKAMSFKNVLFAGMGGSAIGAHILIDYLKHELKIPAVVNRDYTVPNFVDSSTLAICCSYSGNTEETISAYDEIKKRTSNVIVITSNGKLLKKSEEDGFLHIRIPSGYPPRSALGYSFFSLLLLCDNVGLFKVNIKDVDETIEMLKYMCSEKLGLDVKYNSNLSKQIAYKCHRKFPIIYASSDYMDAVALRWRTQFAENSKMLSSTHVFPEMNHNEIVGWQFPDNLLSEFIALFLRDRCEHSQVSKRIEITEDILQDNGFEVVEINSLGDSLLARLFSLIYIGDFVSFYLSILNKVDPTPVKRIDYLKSKLS